MKSIVKIVYPEKKLKVATEDGYEYLELEEGKEFDYELTDKHRCVGYHPEKGRMEPCPEFREIDSGDQCSECRSRDIYTGWRQGSGTPDFEADYSVYLAQIGPEIKVGITRCSRVEQRWREQGADFATEIESGLSPEKALDIEGKISARKGVTERIRKEQKILDADRKKLERKLEELGYKTEIRQIYGSSTDSRTLIRKGRFPSPIKEVKGQIVSNGKYAMAMGSGKVMEKPKQKGLSEF